MGKQEIVSAGSIDRRTERAIWRGMLTKSVRQLADETGLTTDAVLRIRNQMLESVDALSIDQRRTKLLVELQEISDRARQEFETTTDARSKAPLLATSVSAMKVVLGELRNLEKTGSAEVDTLNALRLQELTTLMRETVDGGVAEVAEKFDIDKQLLFDIFNAKLMEAATRLNERHDG